MFYTRLAIVVDGGGAWNSQVALSCFFSGQETSELEEVAVYQSSVSRKVATLHTWAAVMINTGDGKRGIMCPMVIPCMSCDIPLTLNI